MSISDLKRIEPYAAIFFILIAISFLLLTSQEIEVGRAVSLAALFFLILAVLAVLFERVLYGEIHVEPAEQA